MSGLRTTHRAGLKPSGITRIGLENFHDTVHGHEFGGLSRVVMVRKTDQRIFASAKNGEEPKYETVTKETYETFRGNRTERKVTSVEKRGVYDRLPSDLRESLPSVAKVGRLGSPTSKNGSPTSKSGSPTAKTGSPTSKMGGVFSSQKSSSDASAFAADCLAAHNDYRLKHCVPTLKLNRQMCRVSQQWADTLASRGTLTHSQNREYGENIFSFWTKDPNFTLSGRQPVDNWYKEIEKHIFGVEPTSLQSGHFTQVIWKESKELGVAFSKSTDGKFIVVANYSPPGNCIGSFSENVPPVGGFPTKNGVPQNGI